MSLDFICKHSLHGNAASETKNATNPISRTMGTVPSRTFLFKPPEPRKSEVYPRWNFKSFSETNRLVRDELRKEVQRGIHDVKPKACDRIPFVQVAPQSVQQEDVRSVLSLEENPIPRYGNNSRSAQLF